MLFFGPTQLSTHFLLRLPDIDTVPSYYISSPCDPQTDVENAESSRGAASQLPNAPSQRSGHASAQDTGQLRHHDRLLGYLAHTCGYPYHGLVDAAAPIAATASAIPAAGFLRVGFLPDAHHGTTRHSSCADTTSLDSYPDLPRAPPRRIGYSRVYALVTPILATTRCRTHNE
ncbi:hypothetical protein C8J57DRAFT_1512890 [Mycena rebaudengoi]|nr:hypothetical protein C8J57DRAFT_1512890 [Mycena rebaudengoi]